MNGLTGTSTLEKDFTLTVKELINWPVKPIIPRLNVAYISGIPKRPHKGIYYTGSERITKLHNLDIRIESEEKERNIVWKLVYHIDRIKHNNFMELNPLCIFIPDSYNTDRIQFRIAYTHEEDGTIKEQKRIIYLL